nr:MAG TPA: hypothetical protein [Siphoviridae sp. ctdzB12]
MSFRFFLISCAYHISRRFISNATFIHACLLFNLSILDLFCLIYILYSASSISFPGIGL